MIHNKLIRILSTKNYLDIDFKILKRGFDPVESIMFAVYLSITKNIGISEICLLHYFKKFSALQTNKIIFQYRMCLKRDLKRQEQLDTF